MTARWTKFDHRFEQHVFHDMSRADALSCAFKALKKVKPHQDFAKTQARALKGSEYRIAFEVAAVCDSQSGKSEVCCVEIVLVDVSSHKYDLIVTAGTVAGTLASSITLACDRGGFLFWSWDKWTPKSIPTFLTVDHAEILTKASGVKPI